jgi:hypothetical protein
LIFDKRIRELNEAETSFLTKEAATTGYPFGKK